MWMTYIIVFSNSPDEHVERWNELFSRSKNFGVIVNPTKSQFGLSKLQFLGHVVTANGIKPLPSKVEAIQKYPLPKDVMQLCTYLGVINFYHRFVQNLAFYRAPLNEYLKKATKILVKLRGPKKPKQLFIKARIY